jgi:hypothetical protein
VVQLQKKGIEKGNGEVIMVRLNDLKYSKVQGM